VLLTDAQNRFRCEVRDVARQRFAPQANARDIDGAFVAENVRELARRGWLGILWPRELGGMGLDYVSYALGVEEVSRACASTGLTMAAHTSLGTYPIYKFGTAEQKQKYIPALARGEYLGAFGLTEPNAGSDAAGIETTAKKGDNGFIVNGSKRFITSATHAGTVIVAASQDRKLGRKGITCFIAETRTPGFGIASHEKKLGLRGSDTVELVFEEMLLPLDSVLGRELDGYRIFMETLDGGRISIGAFCVGMAQTALDTLVQWFRERELSQLESKAVSDVATQVEAARQLVLHAAVMKDAGTRCDKECAFAKLFAAETAVWAAGTAIDTIGPLAITDRYPVARVYRDSKLGEIGEGTSEVMRMIIAKEVLKDALDSR
jgi:alkylation response protein AidB-like acyl-CoA dehydrogenase